MVDVKKVVLVVVAVGAFLFMSASNGGNSWIKGEELGQTSWYGLWNSCTRYECQAHPFDSIPGELHATRAFTTIGTLLCTAGAIIALVRLCKDVDGKIPAGLLIGAGLCMVIGLAIYTDYSSDTVKSGYVWHGWSYILGWIASIFAFVTGALHVVLK